MEMRWQPFYLLIRILLETDPMESFDVGIIGAGPAGAYGAYAAAKEGLRTVVFEEHEKIGEPVHCGECLSLLATQRLGLELPEEAISLNVKGIRLVYPNRKYSYITEPGFDLEKEKFEQFLAKIGQEKGAVYKLKHRVSNLEREGGSWKISTTQGEYGAKVIIDCSGVAGAASQILKMNEQPKKVIGLQYEMAPVENDGYIEFFLWPRLAPFGYLWIIPKKNQRANVGLVTHDAPSTRRLLEQFIDEYGLRGKKNVKAFGGFIPSSGAVKNTCGDGILLAGDAAGFTSPMFEGGTGLAMTSGKFAAETAADAIRKGDTSALCLSQYEQKWKNEFPDYSKLVSSKNAVYNFNDEEWNRIGSLIPQDLTRLSALDKLKIGARVMLSAPDLMKKGFIPAMEALGKSRAESYGW